jgi:flagellar basal-body rod modification protein FlgD
MTDISATSQQTLDSLLKKIGATPAPTTSTTKHKTQLDQSDFLKLMTAQLSNQDPFQPQSNDQMIAQMAQFSTVSGITQLNSTMTGIASLISENRIATAANFVGKTVLVPGNVAMPDDTGAISGAVDLPSDTSGLQLQISTEQGALVKSIDLGANPAGLVGFQWDGKDSDGNPVGASRYVVTASMTKGGAATQVPTDVYAPVMGANVPTTAADQTLTVGGVGVVKMSDVRAFKY